MEQLGQLIKDNEDIPLGTFCTHPMATVEFNTGNAKPVNVHQYPIPLAAKDKVCKQVKEWLDAGIICKAPYGCEWNLPLCVSSKKALSGEQTDIRVNYDAWLLNALIKNPDRHLIPTIQETHEQYDGSIVFTAYDLKWSFNQFKVNEAHQMKVAFTYNGIQYVFVGAPFGTTSLSHVVQRTVSSIFADLHYVTTFIDNITMHSSSFDDHIEHNREVLTRLNQWNLKLRIAKCHFCYQSITTLGYKVSGQGIVPDPMRVAEAMQWPRPTNGKQVQAFLGLMNFFRESIPGFAHLSGPLDRLRQMKNITTWDDEMEHSFTQLKTILQSAPLLEYPQNGHEFYVATDALDYGIGAVLYQEYDGRKHYIKFLSSTLKGGQRNYSAMK